MPVTTMAQIVVHGIPGQQPAHEGGKPLRTAGEKQVGMVGQQSPGVDCGAGCQGQFTDSINELSPIRLVINDPPPFYAAYNHMVQGTRRIESCLPGHSYPPISLKMVETLRPATHACQSSQQRKLFPESKSL
jgi:hypothetical protein